MKYHLQIYLSFLALIFLVFYSCDRQKGGVKTEKFSPDIYFSQEEKDTLLADIATYIYKKPKYADHKTRFDKKYRGYYVQSVSRFDFLYYYLSEDSTHYYYLIRPARSTKGNARGVGGYFRRNSKGSITDFIELFNTPVLDEKQLHNKGKKLFKEMIKKGNINAFLGNEDYIEWPDENLKYDRYKNEWRYFSNE